MGERLYIVTSTYVMSIQIESFSSPDAVTARSSRRVSYVERGWLERTGSHDSFVTALEPIMIYERGRVDVFRLRIPRGPSARGFNRNQMSFPGIGEEAIRRERRDAYRIGERAIKMDDFVEVLVTAAVDHFD